MRQFAKMRSTFYTGRTGRQIRALKMPTKSAGKDAMLVAQYLIIGPMANQFGLYQLEPETAAVHLPMTQAEIEATLVVLSDIGFSHYDPETRWVWVCEMANHQLGALKPQDNIVASVKRWYTELPHNPFAGPFYDRYEIDLCLGVNTERSGAAVDRKGDKPLRRGSEGPSEGPVSVLSPSQGITGVGGVGGEPTEFELSGAPPAAGPKAAVNGWRQEAFERFWATYPKQVDKPATWQAFTRAAKTPEQAAVIQAGLERLRPQFNFTESGRFLLSPHRWLEREKWLDGDNHVPNLSAKTQQTAKAVARAAQRGAPR